MTTILLLVKGSIRTKTFFTLITAAFLSWLIVYPILIEYRSILSSGEFTSLRDAFWEAFVHLRAYSSERYFDSILIPFNSSGSTEALLAMSSIVDSDLSEEGTLLWQRMFLFWIPRFIWPSKPEALSSNLIGRLTGRLSTDDIGTSVLLTAPGELYIYYGLGGAALMSLVGIFFRFIEGILSPFYYFSLFRIAAFVAFSPSIFNFINGSFESTLTGSIIQISVVYAVLIFTRFLRSNSPDSF